MKRKEIAAGLKALGLKNGDIVLLHSSFLSLGKMENGPSEVIQAFFDVIGRKGTLLAPAFGQLGVLADEIKNLPGAILSSCPVGTVAACGPAAEELCADHWKASTAHGKDTPYTRLAERGGYICLLGVDQDRNTSLHSVEALLELPYLGVSRNTFKTPEGKRVTREYRYYPGPHRNFIGIDRLLKEAGAMKIKRIGNAQVRLIDSSRMFETLLTLGVERPDFMLCSNPECADCVRQRAAIYAADFARESFRLTASSQLAGRYVPEIIENLKKNGIGQVELDSLQGKICAAMPAEQLAGAVRELEAADIMVSGLRFPAVPDHPEKTAELLETAGILRAILPLNDAAPAAAVLNRAKIAVSCYNVAQTAKNAAGQFAVLKKAAAQAEFTFNAANFARTGEHPFLNSYRTGRFIKLIGQLDISDCVWNGEATLPAGGNAEIKELISILRCGNFGGYFCLGGGSNCPFTLDEAAENFRDLLENL